MRALLLLFTLGWWPIAVEAQGLTVTAQTGGSVFTISDNGVLPITSEGRQTVASLVITSTSVTPLLITQIAVAGAEFALTGRPPLPTPLSSSGLSMGLVYLPAPGSSSSGRVEISYLEGGQEKVFRFSVTGTAPDLTFFVAYPDGRRLPVLPAERITFDTIATGSAQTVNMIVANRGSGPATLFSAIVAGRDLQAATASGPIPPGQQISVPLSFVPLVRGTSLGSLSLNFGGYGVVSFTLQGTAAAPDLVVAYALRTDGNARPLGNNSSLTFAATPAATTAIADVVVANQGNAPGLVRSISLTGESFQLTNLPLLPAPLAPTESYRFQVQFTPRQLGTYRGSLRIELGDRVVQVTVEGSTSAPEFQLYYLEPTSRNVLPIADAGLMSFPTTSSGETFTYTFVLQNQGTGTGFVNRISTSGQGFEIVDLPSLPATLASGRDLRFGVRFSPRASGTFAGNLRIDMPQASLNFQLAGTGVGSELIYEVENGGIITEGAELSFRASPGQVDRKVIRIRNNGTGDARISSLAISGSEFRATNVPFLPLTLPVGASTEFTLTFVPVQAAVVKGRLRIGETTFELTGTGLASVLEFSYANSAGPVPVAEGGAVVFTTVRVGESTSVEFTVQNTGTTAVPVSSVAVEGPRNVFTLDGLPPLPVSLEQSGRVRFVVSFSPDTVGNLTGALRINNAVILLRGVGREPVPLPPPTVVGPSGAQSPLQQPAVGVTLAEPYPLALRGALNLTFLSEAFTENPAVQFSSGGRTVAFTIPANTTRAVFDNGTHEMRLQTGTVAGTIQLRPIFATLAGLDITPPNSPILTMTIPKLAPRLLTAEVVGRTATAVAFQVTGYSTARTLRQLEVQIQPRNGQTFSVTSVAVNLEAAAFSWFQTTQSQALGGVFSVTVPLNLRRGSDTEDLTRYIESLSVTVSNELGASNALTIPF